MVYSPLNQEGSGWLDEFPLILPGEGTAILMALLSSYVLSHVEHTHALHFSSLVRDRGRGGIGCHINKALPGHGIEVRLFKNILSTSVSPTLFCKLPL